MYKGTKRAAQRMSRPCVIEITALNDHTSVAIYRLYFYAISELRLQRYNKLINCARVVQRKNAIYANLAQMADDLYLKKCVISGVALQILLIFSE
jgi:hypothetical protein